MIKLAIALLMLLAMAGAAAAATACRSERGSTGAHWAWRQIEGRQCWYLGERGRDKALLFWPREASAAPGSVIATPTDPAPPTAAPELEPEPEPPAPSAEDQLLLESYWPDLATLQVAQWPPAIESVESPQPLPGRDDPIALMILALVAVSALALGLEKLTIARHG